MDNSNAIKQEEKRKENSKSVIVFFPKAKENNYNTFNIVDEEGNLKYDGNVEILPSIADSCSCPSYTFGNKPKGEGEYSDTHGYSFQCKHIIAAREEAKTFCVMSHEISQRQNEINKFVKSVQEETFFESELIQKDLLI